MNHLPTFLSPNHFYSNIYLAQMRLSDECENLKDDEIFNLHLGYGVASWGSIPCFLQDTIYIHWLHLPKQSTKKEQKILKKDQTSNKSYCIILACVPRI